MTESIVFSVVFPPRGLVSGPRFAIICLWLRGNGARIDSERHKMGLIWLDSVGCALDPKTLVTHPVMNDGTVSFDWLSACHIDDCCDEFLDALTDAEHDLVVDAVSKRS